MSAPSSGDAAPSTSGRAVYDDVLPTASPWGVVGRQAVLAAVAAFSKCVLDVANVTTTTNLATFERERGSAHRAGERTKFDLALAGEHGFEALTNAPSASPGSALASPGNPNEPRYCVCRSVSDGKMIGCDNDDCAIEWFHFACVGLNPNAEVKGKWICPPCRRKKR